jgi:hypothetical protein
VSEVDVGCKIHFKGSMVKDLQETAICQWEKCTTEGEYIKCSHVWIHGLQICEERGDCVEK